MADRQSRKLRQLQAEMIALANDREKATSADACRAIDAKLRALAEKLERVVDLLGVAVRHAEDVEVVQHLDGDARLSQVGRRLARICRLPRVAMWGPFAMSRSE